MMTEEQKSTIRKVISNVYVDTGRLKQILITKGINYDYPHSAFHKSNENFDLKTSLVYEVDGLNQLWYGADKLRDSIENFLDLENADFDEVMKALQPAFDITYESITG